MTRSTGRDRSHESIINEALARVLRERLGLDVVAETLHHGRRPDIVVRRPNQAPVILEIEIAPAPTVDVDALARLGMEIDGQQVQNAFAVSVPGQLRSTSQQYLYQRMATATLEWREWRFDGTSGPKLSGHALELGNVVARTIPPAGNLDEAVDILDQGARRAGALLYRHPGTVARVSKIFGADPTEESANMAALVVINAMVFQERLAAGAEVYQSLSAARVSGGFSRLRLLDIWEQILSVDYYPIFKMAKDVVEQLSEIEASEVLDECARTASALLRMGAVGRHDLAGRIFNRLISERKLLAAFFTTVPASTLLAGLALSAARWPDVAWNDAGNLARLRVVDPACGTGTLLMAAYRQILQNHVAADSHADSIEIHQALVEQIIFGADVVQAAIHLTAAALAAMSPSVGFTQMQLHTLRFGRTSTGAIELGSLDWLRQPEIQSSFSATEEQIGARSGTGTMVPLPRADLVISNPPYVRRGSDGGKGEAIARVFSLPQGDLDARKAISKRTSALLKGTAANLNAGHGTSFTVLADRLVATGGRVALVLPVTALSGGSWHGIRQMLASRYEIEFVVSSHDPKRRFMSFDTSIAEVLLVARRLRANETPTRRGVFVNLWRAAYRETDALALVNAVNAAVSAPLHRSDGPPVGGSPLFVGGEQWGELIDGPVGAGPWKASRWKRALTGQFAAALERGELWADDGTRLLGNVPVAAMSRVCNVGPQHRRIRGSLGVFEGYHGSYGEARFPAAWNLDSPDWSQSQFPSIWSLDSSVHQGLLAEPNAWLIPKPDRDHMPIWAQSGTLHITCDVRYNAQRIMAVRTIPRALGVSSWHTLIVRENDPLMQSRREIALALWCNSTLGFLLHANHANRTQEGRGRGNKGMLESLPTLDVRALEDWQLDEARTIWRDIQDRTFQPFHLCAVDPARIELDRRICRALLGLGKDAVNTLARLRTLLATDPSIHGSKKPVLP